MFGFIQFKTKVFYSIKFKNYASSMEINLVVTKKKFPTPNLYNTKISFLHQFLMPIYHPFLVTEIWFPLIKFKSNNIKSKIKTK